MSRLLRFLRRLPPGIWLYWAFLLGLIYAFALIAEEVIEHEDIGFDQVILEAFRRWQGSSLDLLAGFLDVVGGSYFLIPVTVIAAILLWRRWPRTALFLGLGVFGAIALNGIAKLYFERARPNAFDALVPAEGFAFPSGHTMGSTAAALTVYLIVRAKARAWRWPVLIGGVLFALAVGVSRSYLQVHYPSDVVAGWILSTAWVLGVHAWYSRDGHARHTVGDAPSSADVRSNEAPPAG